MSNHYQNNFYVGSKIILDGEPYAIEYSEFVKPGKGQAFTRVKLRRLLVGTCIEKIFKSSGFVEEADIVDIYLTYLYNNGKSWYFMEEKTFEQIVANDRVIGNNKKWMLYQSRYVVTLWNRKPIAVTPPNFLELKIISTNPGIKGNSTVNISKPAILSTGAVVKVPLFIQTGETIKVDTRSGEYISRIK